MPPEITFDPAKDALNRAKHGVSLARASDLRVVTVQSDHRFEYLEPRYRAWGRLDGLPYCLAFTLSPTGVRAISLRRAHLKEYRRYAVED